MNHILMGIHCSWSSYEPVEWWSLVDLLSDNLIGDGHIKMHSYKRRFLGQRTYVLAWYVAWIGRLLNKEGAGNVFGWCLLHCSRSSTRSHSTNSRIPHNPWIQVRGWLKGIPNTHVCINIISRGDRHLRRSVGSTKAREGGGERNQHGEERIIFLMLPPMQQRQLLLNTKKLICITETHQKEERMVLCRGRRQQSYLCLPGEGGGDQDSIILGEDRGFRFPRGGPT